MITWASVILAVLQTINALMNLINREEAVKSGKDAAIADVTASILAKTKAGKVIAEKINALSDDDVDAGLRNLEPK